MEVGMHSDGFTVKRLPQIKSEIEEEVRAVLGNDAKLLPDSVEGQIIEIMSVKFAELWEQLSETYQAFNPLSVTGQALDNLVVLNGLTRLPASPSRAYLTLTGVDTTVVPAGSIVENSVTGSEWLTEEEVTIGGITTGVAYVYASSRDNGVVSAAAGELTLIASPVNGWNTVTNELAATSGRLDETDSELRARRARSLALSGTSSLESIIASVSQIDGVTYVGAVENFTDTVDANGIPAHAFELIALGGDNASIASSIWEKKPVGIEPHGDITVQVPDVFGDQHPMSFSRPSQIQIWVRANITFFGEVPDDASLNMEQAILEYVSGDLIGGSGFFVGDDVIVSRLYVPLNLAYQNHTINSLEVSLDGSAWGTADLEIEFNELSVFDAARIDITVG